MDIYFFEIGSGADPPAPAGERAVRRVVGFRFDWDPVSRTGTLDLATGSLDFGTGGSKPYGSLERIFKSH